MLQQCKICKFCLEACCFAAICVSSCGFDLIFFLLLLKMSDNKDLTPEEIGAILDSYPVPEAGEGSAEEVEDPIIPPFGTPDLRMCKKCGAKAYLRKGGCTNRGCDSGLQGFQGFFSKIVF